MGIVRICVFYRCHFTDYFLMFFGPLVAQGPPKRVAALVYTGAATLSQDGLLLLCWLCFAAGLVASSHRWFMNMSINRWNNCCHSGRMKLFLQVGMKQHKERYVKHIFFLHTNTSHGLAFGSHSVIPHWWLYATVLAMLYWCYHHTEKPSPGISTVLC